MNSIFIALGSNLSDREENIKNSLRLLEEKCKIVKKSSLYETEPVSEIKQDWFLNAVVKVETELNPQELLDFLLSIEKKLGRIRTVKNAPREIDLDILFYRNEIINDKNLDIPHPGLRERRFVLEPLKEISPELVHPVLKKSVMELHNDLKNQEVVNLYKKTF